MQWWNDFLDWLNSTEGARVLSTTVIPFIAIVVAGIVAALIARGSITRLFAKQERAQRASAVEALIAVGEKASQWSGLSGETRDHFEAQTSVASIRVRLLPSTGAAMASAWAEYQLADIKRNSANFSVQADQGYAEYRDRLIEWHHRPARARKLFVNDLERFRLDSANDDTDLIERQRRWKAEQSAGTTSSNSYPLASSSTKTPFVTPAPVAPVAQVTPAAHVTPVTPASTSRPTTATTPAAPERSHDELAHTQAITPVVPSAAARAFTPRDTSDSSETSATSSEAASTVAASTDDDTRENDTRAHDTRGDDTRENAEPEKTRLL
jgi:hypothetical protein